MKKPLALALLFSSLAAAPVRADLPTGSFKGVSGLIRGADVMALIVQKDPANPNAGWAILAEYDRTIEKGPIRWDRRLPASEFFQLTKWIWRLYAYRVEPAGDKRWSLRPLRVSGAAVEPDPSYTPGALALAENGTLVGATLTRYEKGSVLAAETVTFNGALTSTWEDFVPADYFLATDTTGGEYFLKDVNMRLSKDRVADYDTADIKGKFDLLSTNIPKVFVLRAQNGEVKGRSKIEGRIGVFIDIVNWKSIRFTTDELLLINPDDARDVGFYYERH